MDLNQWKTSPGGAIFEKSRKQYEFWILEFGCLIKSQFFKSINSECFSAKISGNGPWVSRMSTCKGQGPLRNWNLCTKSQLIISTQNPHTEAVHETLFVRVYQSFVSTSGCKLFQCPYVVQKLNILTFS